MLKENFVQTLEDCIKINWDREAFSDYKGKTLKYCDTGLQILKLHGLFKNCGLKAGDKVSLIGKNSTDWAMVYLATISYGAIIVPILSDFKAEDIHNIVNHSDSVLFFCGDSIFETLDQSKMPVIKAVFSLSGSSLLLNRLDIKPDIEQSLKNLIQGEYSQEKFKFKPVSNDQVAVISYTSGTTGFSKGVVLQHNSLMANVRFAWNNMPLKAGDKIVSFLPLAHAYGCAFEFLFPHTLGCHITFLTKIPSPKILIQAFQEVRPRLILSVPLVIEKIYKNQLLPQISKPAMKFLIRVPLINRLIYKKIRSKLMDVFGGNFHEVVIGGAAFNQEAEDFFTQIKFPFTIGYGMTECGPLISYSPWHSTKLRSAGKPVDTLEVRIDSDDQNKIPGEILLRGDNVMLGYYKNEEATKAVIDSEGWLHTGDLGIVDKEKNIFIRGRSKSMLLGPSGQNIYPEEIESRINNLRYIMESVVVQRNNKLIALVYPDKDAIEQDQVTNDQWNSIMETYRKSLNQELPAFMNVTEFLKHEQEFEKTPKRSIKRFMYS
jgi:long-chain acyl-CoA synthetase